MEKWLKLSIYKKIQFPLSLGIWIPTYFKGNLHSYRKGGLRGNPNSLTFDSLV